MAGYLKEILASSWSPVVKYNVYNINSEVKEALGANINAGKKQQNEMRSWQLRHTNIHLHHVLRCYGV